MASHLSLIAWSLLLAAAPTGAAPEPERVPVFEALATVKRVPNADKAVPAPVRYALEASVDPGGRIAVRCTSDTPPAFRRWQQALQAGQRPGAVE